MPIMSIKVLDMYDTGQIFNDSDRGTIPLPGESSQDELTNRETESSHSSITEVTSDPNHSTTDSSTPPIKEENFSPKPMYGSFSSQLTTLPHPRRESEQDQARSPTGMASNQSSELEFSHLQQTITSSSPDELESAVEFTAAILEELSSHLAKVPKSTDAVRCLKSIEDLKVNRRPLRTVIGIVGDTGAGKSSLLNAVLGEKKLVPTNGMRACTAVPTEVSWNDSDQPEELYRAEIVFSTHEEWQTELDHLYGDLVGDAGEVSKDINNEKTDAGIAWAKIQAIYPSMIPEELARTSANNLVDDASIQEILATIQKINATTVSDLYKQIHQYIDSRDKNAKPAEGSGPLVLWPLIKVVRIFTKSKALSTGVVLVDLPGVGDSNAARASVADKYLGKCDGIWIVAPIVRAVDNKIAQVLLGESFKLQLKFDGRLSSVSFICSQTDEIMVEEIVDGVGLQKEYEDHLKVKDRHDEEIPTMRMEIQTLNSKAQDAMGNFKSIDKNVKVWELLLQKQHQGLSVFSPSTKGKKRKLASQKAQPKKRHGSQRTVFHLDSDEDEDDTVIESPSAKPLTAEEITTTIAQLKDERTSIKVSIRATEGKINDIEDKMDNLKAEYEISERSLLSLCIKKRNESSRKAIQDQFAVGIKMLDLETAIRDDAEKSISDQNGRDYEKLARSLPVFCTSSRAYQAKMGRLKADPKYEGFKDLEQTEIPQLIAHAHHMTELSRVANCRKFLNGCLLVFRSLGIWLSSEFTEDTLTDNEIQEVVNQLNKELVKLNKTLKTAAKQSADDCKSTLHRQLFSNFSTATLKASKAVVAIAEAWSKPRSKGGYYSWNTFVATCRRDGAYNSKAAGKIDFNEDLIKPFKQEVATAWDKTFSSEIPKILEDFHETSREAFEDFYQALQAHIQDPGAAGRIKMLHPQLMAYVQAIKDGQADFGQNIQDWQREANRELTPGIKKTMKKAYRECKDVRGSGALARMQAIILEQVNKSKRGMFLKTSKTVETRLEQMCSEYAKVLHGRIATTIENMTSDYVGTLRKKKVVAAPENLRQDIIKTLSRLNDGLKFSPAV